MANEPSPVSGAPGDKKHSLLSQALTPRPVPTSGAPPRCTRCGGLVWLRTRHNHAVSGAICVVLGLLLAVVLIGIPILVGGIVLLLGQDKWHVCEECGHTTPLN